MRMAIYSLKRKAIATAILALCSSLIAGVFDSCMPIYSVKWFGHLAIASSATVIVFEARFWKTWAESILMSGEKN